jgi:hypothetical protein
LAFKIRVEIKQERVHLSETAPSAGACLSGRQSRVATMRAPALKAAQGGSQELPSSLKARAPLPLLLCAMLIQPPPGVMHHPTASHGSRSITSSTLPSCCYPSCHRRLSVRADVAHRILLPLHAGSATSTLEAKPRHLSPIVRPPELCHCCPSLGEPRATAVVVPSMLTARPYPIYSPRVDHC